MSSDFFSTRASPNCNSDVSGKNSTLVKNEIEFIQTNLCEVRVASDYGCGFLDGTEERKEEFIEQFMALNSTCFVRSTTDAKERSEKSSKNGILNFLHFFLCYQYLIVCRDMEESESAKLNRNERYKQSRTFCLFNPSKNTIALIAGMC